MSKKIQFYKVLLEQVKSLIGDETDTVAILSNISALLFNEMEDINWAGFYILKQNELVLGPFQGKPACIRIPVGKGVCGCAVESQKIQIVEDVHKFEGHIACDSSSNSEIVIPIRKNTEIFGVLDIDSPIFSRFDIQDKEGLHQIVKYLETKI